MYADIKVICIELKNCTKRTDTSQIEKFEPEKQIQERLRNIKASLASLQKK